MTGESVFTHQIPRISREAGPVILALHPQLGQAIEEAEHATPENYKQWLATWENRYGPEIAVPKFTADTHERMIRCRSFPRRSTLTRLLRSVSGNEEDDDARRTRRPHAYRARPARGRHA